MRGSTLIYSVSLDNVENRPALQIFFADIETLQGAPFRMSIQGAHLEM